MTVQLNRSYKISEAIGIVETYIKHHTPVMEWGTYGIGKTQLPEQITNKLFPAPAGKKNYVWFPVNMRLPEEVHGMPAINMADKQTLYMRPASLPVLPLGPEFAEEGVICIDEINTASRAMFAALNGLICEHRIGDWQIAPGWRFVATGNRRQDKAANTNDMGTALDNRWAHITLEPCIEAWSRHAATRGIDPYLIAFLNLRREFLHYEWMVEKEMRDPRDMNCHTRPSPRLYTEQVNKYMGEKPSMRLELVSGLVGYDTASELEGFMRVAKELARLSDIVADPMNAKVPDDPSAKYAMVAMMIRAAEKKTIGKLIPYAQRLGREFELLFGIDLVRRDPDFANVTAMADWCVRNQDVLLI